MTEQTSRRKVPKKETFIDEGELNNEDNKEIS